MLHHNLTSEILVFHMFLFTKIVKSADISGVLRQQSALSADFTDSSIVTKLWNSSVEIN
jgi:hypothetical protein